MLVQRVDVVTGGASAVYGSDAVTGVVNFVLNKKFEGVKFDVNAGISNYGDAFGYKYAMAAGTSLFGGRGHIEGSIEYRSKDGFLVFDRPYGPGLYAQVGAGTTVNPFAYIPNGRRPNSTFGGLVQGCVPACPLANQQQFIAAGVLGAYNPGVAGAKDASGNVIAGTSNQNSGGDGAYSPYGTANDAIRQGAMFGRFSYDVDDTTSFYVQASASEAYSSGWHFPMKLTPGINQADLFYKDNPFLPAATQTQLANNGTHPVQTVVAGVISQPANTFQLGEFLTTLGKTETNGAVNINRLLTVQAGLDGEIMNGRFNWNLFYTHGENRLAVNLVNNQNYQKLYAASDAVLTGSGTVACYATTQNVAGYSDCVPLNPFGPTSVTRTAWDYFAEDTNFRQSNILDNLGAGIAGTVFDGWAGPIKAALSAETRWNDYTVTTNAPITTVNCTGLRLCNPALPLYAQPVLAPVKANNNVWEIAVEGDIPLVKDLPIAQSIDLNVAGRYTDYSTSGSVQTWKIGFDWNVIDSLRFRGTTSIDIRAPTLNDLFQPAQVAVGGFQDQHLVPPTNGTTFITTAGNSKLVPEVSRTYTVGVVLTPDFASGLTVSLDYFRLSMKNQIGQITASNNNVQQLCEASNGTASYCGLYTRPLPFSDRSLANYATGIANLALNTASFQTEGFDLETNYRFAMADLVDGWMGDWSVRALATYQPVLQQVLFPGAAKSLTIGPKTRFTLFLNYKLNDWSVGLQDRWVSGFSRVAGTIINTGPVAQQANNWVNPHVRSWNVVDLNITKNFEAMGGDMSAYFVVQNLINSRPDLYPTGTNIGLDYPAPPGQDIMGRYFTIGLRANL
jgi:outer membrane receptor protein involved in Fe transport